MLALPIEYDVTIGVNIATDLSLFLGVNIATAFEHIDSVCFFTKLKLGIKFET